MIILEPDDIARITGEVESLFESCLGSHGWHQAFQCRVRTSDFVHFDLVDHLWSPQHQPDIFLAGMPPTTPEIRKVLRWARDLRRRRLVPRLSTIPPDELIDTLVMADLESHYDPVREVASACASQLLAQARARSVVRIEIPTAQPTRAGKEDASGRIVSMALVVIFILFLLEMCSHRPTAAELNNEDQQSDQYR